MPAATRNRSAERTWQLSRTLLVVALVWGLYLRLRMYLMDRAFWLDPAGLALNLVATDYAGLFAKLDYGNQAAPVAFLLVSKFLGSLFDYSELALTFFPLLLATASLGLFLWLSLEVLGSRSAPLAFVPFAACSSAVYYAGEFKQYSGDLFFAVLTLLISVLVCKSGFSRRAILGFGAIGITAAWFSYTAIVVAAGSGLALFAYSLLRRDRRAAATLAATGSVILIHYLLLFFFQIRPTVGPLLEYHAASYAPLPFSTNGLHWWRETATAYFQFPLGFAGSTAIPLLGLTLGAVATATDRENRYEFGILLFPLALVILLSGLHRYPLTTGGHDVNARFLLFTVPCAFLLIGKGMQSLLRRTGGSIRVAIVVAFFLFYPIVERTARWPYFIQQEMRALVEDLRLKHGEGDEVYVYYASIPAFRFYTRKDPIAFVEGRPAANPSADLALDLERLSKTGTVWLVISHDFGRERHYLTQAMNTACTHDVEKAYPGARLLGFHCR